MDDWKSHANSLVKKSVNPEKHVTLIFWSPGIYLHRLKLIILIYFVSIKEKDDCIFVNQILWVGKRVDLVFGLYHLSLNNTVK